MIELAAGEAAALPCNMVSSATNTGMAGLAAPDLSVRYRLSGGAVTVKSLQAGDVTELYAGSYLIQFTAEELASAGGLDWWVEAAGALPFHGEAEIVDYTQDAIGAKAVLIGTGEGSV